MKQILFNTEMVRAILKDRKTVTRRVVKPQPQVRTVPGEEGCYIYRGIPCGLDGMTNLAPYRPGDILYVRESFLPYEKRHIIDGAKYAYKADATPESERTRKDFGYKWRPSIHMPREAARIFLRVTDVRVERLQDITGEDLTRDFDFCLEAIEAVGRDALAGPFWDSTIKPADRVLCGWEANPYVWRIEFKRCEKPKEDI